MTTTQIDEWYALARRNGAMGGKLIGDGGGGFLMFYTEDKVRLRHTMLNAGLDEMRDLSAQGLGRRSVGWMLNALVAGHLNNMAGELSCLKGLQGLKGYPF